MDACRSLPRCGDSHRPHPGLVLLSCAIVGWAAVLWPAPVWAVSAQIDAAVATSSLAITTTYFARTQATASGCTSASCATRSVIVDSPPLPPDSASADRPDVCAGDAGSISLAVQGGGGDVVQWFTGGCGGTPVPGGASPTVSPTETTVFHARTKDMSSGCSGQECTSATVRVCVPVRPDSDHDCDVDALDAQHFTSCAAGPSIPVDGPSCGNADFDADGDVDLDDFGVLQRCFSGEDQLPPAGCDQ